MIFTCIYLWIYLQIHDFHLNFLLFYITLLPFAHLFVFIFHLPRHFSPSFPIQEKEGKDGGEVRDEENIECTGGAKVKGERGKAEDEKRRKGKRDRKSRRR